MINYGYFILFIFSNIVFSGPGSLDGYFSGKSIAYFKDGSRKSLLIKVPVDPKLRTIKGKRKNGSAWEEVIFLYSNEYTINIPKDSKIVSNLNTFLRQPKAVDCKRIKQTKIDFSKIKKLKINLKNQKLNVMQDCLYTSGEGGENWWRTIYGKKGDENLIWKKNLALLYESYSDHYVIKVPSKLIKNITNSNDESLPNKFKLLAKELENSRSPGEDWDRRFWQGLKDLGFYQDFHGFNHPRVDIRYSIETSHLFLNTFVDCRDNKGHRSCEELLIISNKIVAKYNHMQCILNLGFLVDDGYLSPKQWGNLKHGVDFLFQKKYLPIALKKFNQLGITGDRLKKLTSKLRKKVDKYKSNQGLCRLRNTRLDGNIAESILELAFEKQCPKASKTKCLKIGKVLAYYYDASFIFDKQNLNSPELLKNQVLKAKKQALLNK